MNGSRPASVLAAAATLMLALLGACAAGPDFKRPAPPTATGYGVTAPATVGTRNVSGGAAQRLVPGLDIPGEWWMLFRCPPLDGLIERALRANPDVKAAEAALRVAREQVLAQRGAFLPSIDASAALSRQKTSSDLAPVPNSGALDFTLQTAQLSVSYVPDVFGLNRRSVESLGAHAEGARFALLAAQLTLTSNLAAAAVQEASLRAQVDATTELIAINADTLRVLRAQYTQGYAGRLDVLAQESQLAQLTAALPPLRKQLAQQRHVLSALVGALPDQAIPETFELSQLHLPEELPVSLPARLVAQRPDVRQAEESLHAASAQVGVAVASRLPNITLTGNMGSSALATGRIFGPGTEFWGVGAALAQPIFHGGTLLHEERAARAAYEEAAQAYRSTVNTAFQNVADTLTALTQDAEALRAAAASEQAVRVTLDLARKQRRAGYASYLDVLRAEQAYELAVLARTQAQASRYADTIALFQALGGGWWNRDSSLKGGKLRSDRSFRAGKP